MLQNKNIEKIKEKIEIINKKIQSIVEELAITSVDTSWKKHKELRENLELLKREKNHLINLINIIND